MTTLRTKPDMCPECGDVHDAVSNLEGKGVPKQGDFNVCLNCGSINQFDEDLLFVVADKEAIREMRINQPEMYFNMVKFSVYVENRGRIR